MVILLLTIDLFILGIKRNEHNQEKAGSFDGSF